MKNILIVSPQLGGYGGTETVLLKVLNSQLVNTFNFSLLILGGCKVNQKSFESLSDVNIIITNRSQNFYRAIDFAKFILANCEDIIICLSREELMVAFYIRKLFHLKYKIVSWIHFSLKNNKTNFKKYCDYHLSISSGNTKELIKRKINEKNIFTIYNPISTNTNEKIDRSSKVINFIYVGRIIFQGQKNLKELIDGLATWSKKNWLLSLFGTGPDIDKCKQYIARYYPKLVSNFKWMGWQKNPWEKIDSASALILTSKLEGFPMVLLEALSRGVPCVSSNCLTGPDDIIINGLNGYLYQLGNLKDFHRELNKVLLLKTSITEIKSSINKFDDSQYFNLFKKSLLQM